MEKGKEDQSLVEVARTHVLVTSLLVMKLTTLLNQVSDKHGEEVVDVSLVELAIKFSELSDSLTALLKKEAIKERKKVIHYGDIVLGKLGVCQNNPNCSIKELQLSHDEAHVVSLLSSRAEELTDFLLKESMTVAGNEGVARQFKGTVKDLIFSYRLMDHIMLHKWQQEHECKQYPSVDTPPGGDRRNFN